MDENKKQDCSYLLDSIELWANTIAKLAEVTKKGNEQIIDVAGGCDFIKQDAEIILKLTKKIKELI